MTSRIEMGQGNYPDDIRNFDDHPQSPYYIEPLSECQECQEFFDEDDMASEHLCKDCDAEQQALYEESVEV